MSEQDITSYLGFMPDNFNKEFTELFREVCVERGYFNKTVSKKIKFYRLPDSDYEKLTDGQEVLLQGQIQVRSATLTNRKKEAEDV